MKKETKAELKLINWHQGLLLRERCLLEGCRKNKHNDKCRYCGELFGPIIGSFYDIDLLELLDPTIKAKKFIPFKNIKHETPML